MTLFLAFFEFHDFYYALDGKLTDLGYTDPGKWVAKWAIKNILLTTFLLCQFRVQRRVNYESLLKFALIGIAVTAAWIPCLKNFPTLSVILKCFETFLMAIGPLHSIPITIRNLRYSSKVQESISLLIISNTSIILLMGPLVRASHSDEVLDFSQPMAMIAVTLLACIFIDEAFAEFKQNRERREVAEWLEEERRLLQVVAVV